jgi:hypothetical protein
MRGCSRCSDGPRENISARPGLLGDWVWTTPEAHPPTHPLHLHASRGRPPAGWKRCCAPARASSATHRRFRSGVSFPLALRNKNARDLRLGTVPRSLTCSPPGVHLFARFYVRVTSLSPFSLEADVAGESRSPWKLANFFPQ